MPRQIRPTYVGTLEAVVVERDGAEQVVWVERRPLGVIEGLGLVTAASREDLAEALVDGPPARAERRELKEIYYYRRRRGHRARRWRHETPGARVRLYRDGDVAVAYLEAPNEGVCPLEGGGFLRSLA